MYNVLEALREGRALTAKEKVIHEHGLVSVLKQIHDELDAAVFDAYRWPKSLDDEGILERLVALNAERAEEEKRGLIRRLRPEYQAKGGAAADGGAGGHKGPPVHVGGARRAWPGRLKEQIAAVREVLAELGDGASAAAVAAVFEGVGEEVVAEVLEVV